jgi:hypothetical protein
VEATNDMLSMSQTRESPYAVSPRILVVSYEVCAEIAELLSDAEEQDYLANDYLTGSQGIANFAI